MRRRRIRGRGRVGASSAAKNSVHLALLKENDRRLAKASSARARALSRTNALTVRFEAEAAASNVRLVEELTRRSSFSVRSARIAIACLRCLKRYRKNLSMSRHCHDSNYCPTRADGEVFKSIGPLSPVLQKSKRCRKGTCGVTQALRISSYCYMGRGIRFPFSVTEPMPISELRFLPTHPLVFPALTSRSH